MEVVTGATGYIGGRLIRRLISEGRQVRAFARDPARLEGAGVEVAGADLIDGTGLAAALDGCQTAYYLIHSMEQGARDGAFAGRDRLAADNFARAAQEAGIERIVYLGGLVPEGG